MSIYPSNLTKLCISISQDQNIRIKFHNTAYKLMNLNYLYIPLKFENLNNLKLILNKFNIHGCSVSMPFYEKVLKYLDKKDLYN